MQTSRSFNRYQRERDEWKASLAKPGLAAIQFNWSLRTGTDPETMLDERIDDLVQLRELVHCFQSHDWRYTIGCAYPKGRVKRRIASDLLYLGPHLLLERGGTTASRAFANASEAYTDAQSMLSETGFRHTMRWSSHENTNSDTDHFVWIFPTGDLDAALEPHAWFDLPQTVEC